MRTKFDKLCNISKLTGDPTCSPAVRRDKRIPSNLQRKAQSTTLRGIQSDDDDDGRNWRSHECM